MSCGKPSIRLYARQGFNAPQSNSGRILFAVQVGISRHRCALGERRPLNAHPSRTNQKCKNNAKRSARMGLLAPRPGLRGPRLRHPRKGKRQHRERALPPAHPHHAKQQQIQTLRPANPNPRLQQGSNPPRDHKSHRVLTKSSPCSAG